VGALIAIRAPPVALCRTQMDQLDQIFFYSGGPSIEPPGGPVGGYFHFLFRSCPPYLHPITPNGNSTGNHFHNHTMLSWLTWAQPFSKWEQGKIPGHNDPRRSTDCGCSSAKVGMTGVENNFGVFSGLACTSRDLSRGHSRSSS
jgi:hypothetical protein